MAAPPRSSKRPTAIVAIVATLATLGSPRAFAQSNPQPTPTPTQPTPTPTPPTPPPATSALSPVAPPGIPSSSTALRLARRAREVLPTYEPPAPRFGARGQWILRGSTHGWVSSQSVAHSAADAEGFGLAGGGDHFVWNDVAIGLSIVGGWSSVTGYEPSGLVRRRSTVLGGELRVGWNVPLAAAVSFFPQLRGGVLWDHSSVGLREDARGQTMSDPAVRGDAVVPHVGLSLPVLVHPVPHLFLGAGPFVDRRFGGSGGERSVVSGQSTTVGAEFVFGGSFGGESSEVPTTDAPAPIGKSRRPRFGDRGTTVLGVDTSATALLRFDDDGGYRRLFGVSPTLDHFFASRFSLGLLLALEHEATKSVPSSRTESFSLGGGVRAGIEFPLADRVSLYPRVAFGASRASTSRSFDGERHDDSDTSIWGTLDLPLLFHLTTHAFIGAGPRIFHDFSRQYDPEIPGADRLLTDLRLTASVGGWL